MSRKMGGLIALWIAVVAGIAFGISSWLWPRRWTESVAVHVAASPSQVFHYLERSERWPQWLGWPLQDPTWVHVLGPIQSGENASLQWNGASVGVGQITLTDWDFPHQAILRIDIHPGGQGQESFTVTADAKGAELKIQADFDLGFNPWARYSHRLLREQTEARIHLEGEKLKVLSEKDALWSTAQRAADADSISRVPIDTVSTEIPSTE